MLCKNSLILVLVCRLFVTVFSNDMDTLEVVHILFRHGEKNPDTIYTYPTDPYINETYLPFLQGQLNKIGRQTMYDLGKVLRIRYHNFLGQFYNQEAVDAWSSPFPRCKLSLQLVMASLFVPSQMEIWNVHLNWQPTVYNSVEVQHDNLFLNILTKQFFDNYGRVCETEEAQVLLEKYNNWLKYIKDHSGSDMPCIRSAYILYAMLDPQKDANLSLPEWTKPIYPQILEEFVHLEFQFQVYTNKLKAILVGDLLRKILNDTENRIERRSERKFFLYSGHDVNVVHMLQVFGLMYPHIPNYGSCFIMEVHKIKDKHVLKIFYRDHKHTALRALKTHEDKTEISLEEFKKIVDDIFVDEVNYVGENSSAKCIKFSVLIIIMSLYFFITIVIE